MNKIKLIALDLDGTALTPQNKVAETTTDAVRRAREAGVYVARFDRPHLRRGA